MPFGCPVPFHQPCTSWPTSNTSCIIVPFGFDVSNCTTIYEGNTIKMGLSHTRFFFLSFFQVGCSYKDVRKKNVGDQTVCWERIDKAISHLGGDQSELLAPYKPAQRKRIGAKRCTIPHSCVPHLPRSFLRLVKLKQFQHPVLINGRHDNVDINVCSTRTCFISFMMVVA